MLCKAYHQRYLDIHCEKLTMTTTMTTTENRQRAKTINGKIGTVADPKQNEIVQFLSYEYLEESPDCVEIPNIPF